MKPTIEQDDNFGTGKKTLPIYITAIIFCVILTLIPFYVVKLQLTTPLWALAIVFITATCQFATQVICFLRLNFNSAQAKMNIMSLIFTIVVMAIIIAGSLWIMWNLNYNMMH